MVSNFLPGNDSFALTRCNGNVISEPLLNNGRVVLAPPFRHSAVTFQYKPRASFPAFIDHHEINC
jgi:hypothetical protein